MKVLHLSFHYGCISDIDTVMKKLGCEVDHQCLCRKIPYHINENLAHSLWNQNKDDFNQYDVIITSDTVALAYIFLLHLQEVKPFLIILNCNRFSYAMEGESKFFQLLQTIQRDGKYLNKVLYLPYTDFERVWCAKHKVYLHERAIMPVGKYIQHVNDKNLILECFKPLDTSCRHKEKTESIFLQNYHNHHAFMNLKQYLRDNDISVDFGSYVNIEELKDYKAIVVLPDQFSKYFTFESIQNEFVVIMPSPAFLMELTRKPGYYFSVEGSSGLIPQEYINLCEWTKYPETRIYFNSLEEMVSIIKNLTTEKIESVRKWCRFYGQVIEEEHMIQWKNIFNKIILHKQLSA